MDITTIVRTLTPLTDAFEFYSIPYYLTGSLAISVYAVKAQAVQGIEVVADIKFSHVPALVVQLEKTYDVKEIAIRDAIVQRGSFMLVHHDTLQKIGVTLPAYRAYSQVKQEQAHRHTLDQGSRLFRVASPEDTILLLLEHYKGSEQRTPASVGDHPGDSDRARSAARSHVPQIVGYRAGCHSPPRTCAGNSRPLQGIAGYAHVFDTLSTHYPQGSTSKSEKPHYRAR